MGEFDALVRTSVYFGHQSVGRNLIAGVEELIAEGRAPGVTLVNTRDPSVLARPAFVHFDAGRNRDPESKNTAFIKVLDARSDRTGGIALLKYCYVDVHAGTDPDALFARYREFVRAVKRGHPDIRLVHVSIPLTTDDGLLRAATGRLLRKTTRRELNAKRSRYNALLRDAFANEPFFDLAEMQSTRPDASRVAAAAGPSGTPVYALAPSYTFDGGHLNSTARRTFGERLLQVLAKAASTE